MNSNNKPVGRPKLYDSPTEKIEAFRRRLESAGLMRKEVLVTHETWDTLMTLAKAQGVSTSDAASGLLEHAAKAYATKQAKAAPRPLDPAPGITSSSKPKPKPKATADPIQDFFNKRRERVQASAHTEAPDQPANPSINPPINPPSQP
jgi:hypothetical protein